MKDDGWWKRLDQFSTAVFAAIIFVIVLAGTWDLATLQANGSKAAGEQARRYAAESEQKIANTCIGSDSLANAKCATEIINASFENQRAEKDIVAQEAMGRWALLMLYMTGGGLIVTGIGIYYVRENLAEMERGRTVSENALAAAHEANAVSREIGEAQVRAYLSCSGGRFEIVASHMTFKPEISNSGQSPARSIKIRAKVRIAEPNIISTPVYGEISEGDCGVIGADGGETGYVVWLQSHFQSDIYERMRTMTERLEVVGKIRWFDVFGKPQDMAISLQSNPRDDRTFMTHAEGWARRGMMDVLHQESVVKEPDSDTDDIE